MIEERAADPVAEAMRDAGPRTPLPDLDLDSLAAPARDAWLRGLEERRRRRRRRFVFAAAAALGFLAVGLWLVVGSSLERPVGTVVARTGDGGAPELRPGSELWAGRRLVTSEDPGEWLTVELRSGHRLRLDAGSALRLDGASRIELESGRIFVEAAAAELRLLAGGAEIEHLGTSYMVSLAAGSPSVRVRHGRVLVTEGDRRLEVGRGQEAWKEETGELEVRQASPHGEAWAWIRRAAPPFDSDGAELASFLAWVEAETGLEIRIDPALLLDHRGEPVRIRGTVDDSSPEEALEIVLAGAGLRPRPDGDRLWIEPVGADSNRR